MNFNTVKIENVDMKEIRKGNFNCLHDKTDILVKPRVDKKKAQRCSYLFNLNGSAVYKFEALGKSFTKTVTKNHMIEIPPLVEVSFFKALNPKVSPIPVFVNDIVDKDVYNICEMLDNTI